MDDDGSIGAETVRVKEETRSVEEAIEQGMVRANENSTSVQS